MKKEDFVALGISEELAAKAEKAAAGEGHQDQGQTTGGTEEGQWQQ